MWRSEVLVGYLPQLLSGLLFGDKVCWLICLFPALGSKACTMAGRSYMSTWGLNSGSQACARSPSLAQPSPKPPFWLCGFLFFNFFKKMTQAFTVTQASLLYPASASQTMGIQACPPHLVYLEVGTELRASCPLGRHSTDRVTSQHPLCFSIWLVIFNIRITA